VAPGSDGLSVFPTATGLAVGSIGNLLGGCRGAQQAVEVGVEDCDRVLDREDADEHVGCEAVGEGDERVRLTCDVQFGVGLAEVLRDGDGLGDGLVAAAVVGS
jgi:hypothetical protein